MATEHDEDTSGSDSTPDRNGRRFHTWKFRNEPKPSFFPRLRPKEWFNLFAKVVNKLEPAQLFWLLLSWSLILYAWLTHD